MPFNPLFGLLGQSLIGQNQIGPAAPPFNPGPMNQGAGGLAPPMNQPAAPPDLVGLLQQQPTGEPGAPPMGSQLTDETPQRGSFFDAAGGFFDNLDQSLQSPSRVLGLGLLNRLGGPTGSLAGLAAMGLLGRR